MELYASLAATLALCVAGGIVVIAIREELRDQHSTLLPFFAAVVLASAGIVTLQFWQGAH